MGEFDSCQYWRNDQVLVQEQIEQYLERVLMCKYFANLRILLTLRTYSKHLEKKKWSMIFYYFSKHKSRILNIGYQQLHLLETEAYMWQSGTL